MQTSHTLTGIGRAEAWERDVALVELIGQETCQAIAEGESNIGTTAVDPVVVVVNSAIAVYLRNDLQLPPERIEIQTLTKFLGVPEEETPFDVRIDYDPGYGPRSARFVLCALSPINGTGSRHAFLAISPAGGLDDIMPLVGWTVQHLDGSSTDDPCRRGGFPVPLGLDYAALGYDDRAWYITSELINNGAQGWNVSVFIADKQSDPVGQMTRVLGTQFLDDAGVPMPCFPPDVQMASWHPQPARPMGSPPFAYFVGVAPRSIDDPLCDSEESQFNVMRLYAIVDPFGPQPQYRFTDLVVPCFWATKPPGAPAGPGSTVNTLDARVLSVIWCQEGDDSILYCVQGVRIDDMIGSRKALRLTRIRTNGWPDGDPEVLDVQAIDGGGVQTPDGVVPRFLFMAGMAFNNKGDMGLVMFQASEAELLSIQAAGRLGMNDDDTQFPRFEIKASELPTGPDGVGTSQAFGDYASIALDPDGETFWVIGEYVRAGPQLGSIKRNPTWSTWVAHIRLEPEG